MERGEIPGEIAVVISNVAEAQGLAKAKSLRMPTVCIPHRFEASRAAHEEKVLSALANADVEWVCLAGYMRLLSAAFVDRYPHRILNIHPALLPAFTGMDAQQQAVDWGVKVSGCTVHLVDAELDHGPIVLQRAVPVHDDDNPISLSARILAEEHKAYPEALRRLIAERWRIEGRKVVFS
jgi:phosphoribosylglycinamide formyltransferase-1